MAPASKRTSRSGARTKTKKVPPSARRVRGGLPCPECDFVAKHAMGLGRHRSSRHGVASKRSQRTRPGGRWLTRHQAAERAGVHYNTVRQWEQAGLVSTTRRTGVRGVLLSADDLERFLIERGDPAAGGTPQSEAAIEALQERYDRLIVDLEQLLAVAKKAKPKAQRKARASTRKSSPAKRAAKRRGSPRRR